MRNIKAKDIMVKEVVTATPEDVVAAAWLKMIRLGVGGLPVVKGNKVVGIITHRDTVIAGAKNSSLKVEDIMTSRVLTVDTETPLKEIVRIMKKTGYQRLPVTDKDRLVGIVTQTCIISVMDRCL